VREDEAKRRPAAGGEAKDPPLEKAEVGSRQHVREEAVEKDRASMDAVVGNPGAPPDPGMEEDYGARSGEVPSQEPGNPAKDAPRKPT
jgi:hypothetical protein